MRTKHIIYTGIALILLAVVSATAAAAAGGKTCDGRALRGAVEQMEYSVWFCAFSLDRFGASIAPSACSDTMRDVYAMQVVKRGLERDGCTRLTGGPTDEERRAARNSLDYLAQQVKRTGALLPQ